MSSGNRRAAIALGVLIVIVGGFSFFGAIPWILIAIVAAVWVVGLGGHYGYSAAAPLALFAALWLILIALIVSARLHASPLSAVAVAFVLFGLLGSVLLAKSAGSIRAPSRSAWWEAGGAAIGAVTWVVAQLFSLRLPTQERLNWVMRNDSMNNLILSHAVIHSDGIVTGVADNPTPLPASLLALGASVGRGTGASRLLLEHDLVAATGVWGGLIAVTAVLCGLTAAAIVRAAVGSGWASRLAALGGSLLGLSWFFTGYAIEFGFINANLVLPVLLGGILLYFSAQRSPWLVITGLGVACTLIFAIWSPLVVVPLALIIAVFLRQWKAIRRMRTAAWIAIGLSAAQLLAYSAVAVIPVYLHQKSALSAAGGIYNPGNWVVFVAAGLVLVPGVILFRNAQFIGLAGVVLGSLAGLAALLFLSRRVPDPWTYYPIKLAGFSTLVFIVLALGLCVALIARYRRPRSALIVASVLVSSALFALIVVVPTVPGDITLNPVVRMVTRQADSPYVVEDVKIQQLAASPVLTILWKSGYRSEAAVDLWLLQLDADTLSPTSKLRHVAYAQYDSRSLSTLCRIVRLVGPVVIIRTADPGLGTKLRAACPAPSAKVVIDRVP
jgi:hypothetical protein